MVMTPNAAAQPRRDKTTARSAALQ